jgi:hypothetical protein
VILQVSLYREVNLLWIGVKSILKTLNSDLNRLEGALYDVRNGGLDRDRFTSSLAAYLGYSLVTAVTWP